jgi:hypothetical protein
MLVQINPSAGGGTTDFKTRFFNFMCSLNAVATAAAGSTPVVNPVNASGVKNTEVNCITVLSNTVAGGWTAGVSNNTTPATVFNASNATSQIVDLFNTTTGKSTYPHYRMVFGNFLFPFNNANISSFPQAEFYLGHTSANPAVTAYTADTSYANHTWSTGRNANVVNQTQVFNGANASTPLNIAAAGITVTVACTSTYLIITTPTDILYFGVRSTSPWENNLTDNPPWVAFSWAGVGATQNYNFYNAWAARFLPNGTSNTTSAKYGTSLLQTASAVNIFTSQGMGTATWPAALQGGLYPGTTPLASMASAGAVRWEAPTIDPTTGLAVPSAYPLVMYTTDGSRHASGIMPGILRGPSTNASGLDTFAILDEYTISGSVYRAVRINTSDLFFIKKE